MSDSKTLDLKAQTKIPVSVPVLSGNEWRYIKESLDDGWVSTAGPFVKRFEQSFSQAVNVHDAVALSSGTAALHLALKLAGIKSGDGVIVPTLTFIAPINAVKYVGGQPFFMDCDPYLNMDVRKLKRFLEEECVFDGDVVTHQKTNVVIKAIVVVHVFGHLADMESILKSARAYKLKVIEDAAEAIGSQYKSGSLENGYAGTVGDFGCYSFNGNKLITSGGGGMLVSSDQDAIENARYLSTQAKDDSERFIHNEVGFNYRLTNIQAALGCAQLELLETYLKIKRNNFNLFTELLGHQKGILVIKEPSYSQSNYWFYTLRVIESEAGCSAQTVRQHLQRVGIQTRPLWYLNHLQKPYKKNIHYNIVAAQQMISECINIPCSVNLTRDQIVFICDSILECLHE